MGKSGVPRFGELDLARGIAVVSMVIFHGCQDYSLLKLGRSLEGDFFLVWQQATAIFFLALFGVAAYLDYRRHGSGTRAGFRRRLRKGALLFGWGMLITFMTFLYLREGFVTFGILHLMGVSSVLLFPLLPFKYLNLAVGTVIIIAGYYLDGLRFNFAWLTWLGLIPAGFNSVDYFPIAPWFGYILIGVFLGHLLYPGGKPRFNLFVGNPMLKFVSFLGRHSLLIYLIHQPLLLAVIDRVIMRLR